MIVSWMLYASVVGILVGAAAVSAERILRGHHLPTRWMWCASLLLSLILPLLGRLLPESPTASVFQGGALAAPVVESLQDLVERAGSRAGAVLGHVEALLVRGWGLGTFLLVTIVAISILRLRAARESWREETVDGTPVLVSEDVGPAVLGIIHQRIVLPAWVLTRSGDARELILSHEREHVRARDPLLVVASAIPSLLVPWHVPLWWQYRRLRLAVEMDCDERVLRHASSSVRRRYGHLLLEVGRRKSGVLALAAPFAEERSFLGYRIRGLAEKPPIHPLRRDALLSAMGLVLMTAAWSVPRPEQSATPEIQAYSSSVAPSPGAAVEPVVVKTDVPTPDASVGDVGPAQETRIASSIPAEPAAAPELAPVADVQMSQAPELVESTVASAPGTADPLPALLDETLTELMAGISLTLPDGPSALTSSAPPQGIVRPTFPQISPSLYSDQPAAETDLDPTGAFSERAPAEDLVATSETTIRPQILNADEVQKQMERRYPTHLLDAGIGGTVVLDFFVDESGVPTEWLLVQSSGYQNLDDAALKMASTFRFSPARTRDHVVPVWTRFPIRFQVL